MLETLQQPPSQPPQHRLRQSDRMTAPPLRFSRAPKAQQLAAQRSDQAAGQRVCLLLALRRSVAPQRPLQLSLPPLLLRPRGWDLPSGHAQLVLRLPCLSHSRALLQLLRLPCHSHTPHPAGEIARAALKATVV